jgi:hypothetical protein
MTYQKPEVNQIGTAISAIEAGFSKDNLITEGSDHSVDAYMADE